MTARCASHRRALSDCHVSEFTGSAILTAIDLTVENDPGTNTTLDEHENEITNLSNLWSTNPQLCASRGGRVVVAELVGAEELEGIDLFDRLQLAAVLKVCRESRTLSDAGRTLFGSSRERKKTANDADRLRKYLARFGLSWDRLKI